jgi:hypothetical protein
MMEVREASKYHRPKLIQDSIFLDKDFEGLKRAGKGSKKNNSGSIGKSGRGSQTMYHWTDVQCHFPEILIDS